MTFVLPILFATLHLIGCTRIRHWIERVTRRDSTRHPTGSDMIIGEPLARLAAIGGVPEASVVGPWHVVLAPIRSGIAN